METNFKVDVPSFALGYSTGVKKVPPSQEKEVTITENGKTEILPDEKQLLSKVTVNTNVKLGFNIAYGTEPPEDTSKLWVKTEQEANNVIVSEDQVWENGSRPERIEKLSTSMTNPIKYVGTAAVGNRVYMFGGGSASTTKYNTIKYYDIDSGSFVICGIALPKQLVEIAAEAVGTKVFLFGGADANNNYGTCYVFDTVEEKLDVLSATTDKLRSMPHAVIGSDIYLIGGVKSNGTTSQTVYKYDTENLAIGTVSVSMGSFYIYGDCCEAVDGKIYMFSPSYVGCFDPETKKITDLKIPGLQLHDMTTCSVGGKIYIFGGWTGDSSSNSTKTIYCFDPATGELSLCKSTLAAVTYGASAVGVGDKAYVFGGTNSNIHKFEPQIGRATLENNILQIIPNTTENVFPILKNGKTRIEVNVGEVYKGDEKNEAMPVEACLYKDSEWVTI